MINGNLWGKLWLEAVWIIQAFRCVFSSVNIGSIFSPCWMPVPVSDTGRMVAQCNRIDHTINYPCAQTDFPAVRGKFDGAW